MPINTERYLNICINLKSMTVQSASFPSHGVDSPLPFNPSAHFAALLTFPELQHRMIARVVPL